MEHSIQDVARAAGVSSRTLRHYDAIGLLPARRVSNGYRTYGTDDLIRLQRILLLRDLGLGLGQIQELLAGDTDDLGALRTHLDQLRHEHERLDRQIATVQRTITAIEKEQTLMTDEMFDGFDHTQYREEVEHKWGEQAYADSDRWWRSLADGDKREFSQEHRDIAAQWQRAREGGLPTDSPQVQQIAARHAAWIAVGWGGRTPSPEALIGLAQMYVADERFAANYGGVDGAQYVCDGLTRYAHGG